MPRGKNPNQSTPSKAIKMLIDAAAFIDKKEESTPRERFEGALLDSLGAAGGSSKYKHSIPVRAPETPPPSPEDCSSSNRRFPNQQPYVLKLFDRKLDLSQFTEDSPLYPVCRAWVANQPKADYSKFGEKSLVPKVEDEVQLPGPQGPVVSRIPELLPEQKEVNKDINLDYSDEDALPSREELLQSLMPRWTRVRNAWLKQAQKANARYSLSQEVLSAMKVNTKRSETSESDES